MGQIFSHRELVNWGDCDAAGIVFYPNFFRWSDNAFHAMTRACGFDQASLAQVHGLLGTPLADAAARFLSPARPGDMLDIAVRITHLGRTSIRMAYALSQEARAVAEVTEARVFVRLAEERLRPAPIPEPLRAALGAYLVAP